MASRSRARNPSYKQALADIREKDELDENTGSLSIPMPVDIDELMGMEENQQIEKVATTLNCIIHKVAEGNLILNHESEGLQAKFSTSLKAIESNEKKFENAELAIMKLTEENRLLKGIIHRQSQQIDDLNIKVAGLTARSMKNNVTISNLEGDKKDENCKDTVITFLRAIMEIDADESEISIAHRLGKYNPKKPAIRSMIVKCSYDLKERIMSNIKNIKDKVADHNGKPYYVNRQLPEQIIEQNRRNKQLMYAEREKYKGVEPKKRPDIKILDKVVCIDGDPMANPLPAPQPLDLFTDQAETDKIDKIKLSASDITTEQGSTFQAFSVKTSQLIEAQRAYKKVRQLHPSATHVIAAVHLKNQLVYQDDGEHSGGNKMSLFLKDNYEPGISIYIVRCYGNKKLGPDRFTIMKEVATQALDRSRAKKKPNR